MYDFQHELGSEAKDIITGYKGIVTGRAQHLTGCNTYGVTSQKLSSDGKETTLWFDENRLKVAKEDVVKLHSKNVGAMGSPKPTRSNPK